MNRPVKLLALAVVVAALTATEVPRASAATPDVPFFGAKVIPNLPDSYIPGRKLNAYTPATSADWTAGAFVLESGSGLPYLLDVGPDFRKDNPDLLSATAQDITDLTNELAKPTNKKKVVIRTKSDTDRQFLYVVFEVLDSTVPKVASTSGDVDGDRVTILIDPENNKTPAAANAPDTRLRITYQVPPRGPGAPAVSDIGRIFWDRRNLAVVTPQDETTLPPDFKLAYAGNDLGYTVAMQIPINWAGLARKADFGLGFSVVNVTRNKLDGFPLAFAIAYPNSDPLKPNTVNLPYNSIDQVTGWENQANWGTGYFRGDLGTIVLHGGPPNYHSPDIRIGTEAALKFDDVKDYSVDSNTNWYKYKATAPCVGRFWGQVHRNVPATPMNPAARDIKVRLLFLWGPAGVPPVELYYIGLSDPFLVRRDTTDREMYQPVVWANPVKNLPGHPCIVAMLLPDILDIGVYNEAKFKTFQTQVDDPTKNVPYPGATWNNIKVDLSVLKADYKLTDNQLAQMNVDPVGNFVCPAKVDLPNPPKPEPEPTPAPVGFRALLRAFDTQQSVAARIDAPLRRDRNAEPPTDPRDVLVDFEGFAYIRPTGKNKTLILEPLGGVRKLVSVDYLKKTDNVLLTFNVTNPAKEPREIGIGHFAKFPPELKGYRVEVPPVGGTFKPGETRQVVAVLTSRPEAPPVVPPCICPPGNGPFVTPRYERRHLLFRRWR